MPPNAQRPHRRHAVTTTHGNLVRRKICLGVLCLSLLSLDLTTNDALAAPQAQRHALFSSTWAALGRLKVRAKGLLRFRSSSTFVYRDRPMLRTVVRRSDDRRARPLEIREILTQDRNLTTIRVTRYGKQRTLDKPHKHPQVQTTHILMGRVEAIVGGRRRTLGSGDSVRMEGNIFHAFRNLTEKVVLYESFSPARLDFPELGDGPNGGPR